jgi:hypothetical protein
MVDMGPTIKRSHESVDTTATQVAMWLTEVKVGDIIVMRHTYPTCHLLPEKLKALAPGGVYKPVYVVVRVVRPPTPTSRMSLCDPKHEATQPRLEVRRNQPAHSCQPLSVLAGCQWWLCAERANPIDHSPPLDYNSLSVRPLTGVAMGSQMCVVVTLRRG